MEIKQLQVGYNDAQDRMILRINIDDDKFANLVLTRRICRFMLDHIGPFIKVPALVSAQSPAAPAPGSTAEVGASADSSADRRKPRKAKAAVTKSSKADATTEPKATSTEPKADYQTPFEDRSPEGNLFGVGALPPVVVNAGCQPVEPNLIMTLQFENQQTMTLTLSQHLAKGIYRLMFDLAERIQWFSGISGLTTKRDDAGDSPVVVINPGSVTYH